MQCVDAELAEDEAELVHERNVDVALGVFDDLGGFGHADAAGLVGAGGDDAGVEGIDHLGHGGGAAAGDFFDAGQAVLFVTRVDALGAVAAVEVDVVRQPAFALEHRHADFFSGAGVDGGFIDDDVARLEHPPDGGAGLDERAQVRPLGGIHRGGHGDDVDLRLGEFGRLGGVAQLRGLGELFRTALQRVIPPRLQLRYAGGVDVKADDGADFAELDGQGQADVA